MEKLPFTSAGVVQHLMDYVYSSKAREPVKCTEPRLVELKRSCQTHSHRGWLVNTGHVQQRSTQEQLGCEVVCAF